MQARLWKKSDEELRGDPQEVTSWRSFKQTAPPASVAWGRRLC
jgi:hypothetical protein